MRTEDNKKEKVEAIYSSGAYLDKHSQLHKEDVEWKFKTIEVFLNDYVRTVKNHNRGELSILDIGGGTGDLLEKVIKFFEEQGLCIKRIVCVDLLQDALDLQKKKFVKYNATFFGGSVLDFETEEHFDFVLAMHVLEHLFDYQRCLQLFKTISSTVLLQVPLHDNIFEKFLCLATFNKYKNITEKTVGHIQWFNYWGFRKVLSQYGTIVQESFPDVFNYFLRSHYVSTMPWWFLWHIRIAKYLYILNPKIAALFAHSFYTSLLIFDDGLRSEKA